MSMRSATESAIYIDYHSEKYDYHYDGLSTTYSPMTVGNEHSLGDIEYLRQQI